MKRIYYFIIPILGLLGLGLAGCSNEDEPEIPTSFEEIIRNGDISYLHKLEKGSKDGYYKLVFKDDSINGQAFRMFDSGANPYTILHWSDCPEGILIKDGEAYFTVNSNCSLLPGFSVHFTGEVLFRCMIRALYLNSGKEFTFLFPAQWVDHNSAKAMAREYRARYNDEPLQTFDIMSCTKDNLLLVRNAPYRNDFGILSSYLWFNSVKRDQLLIGQTIKVDSPETYYYAVMDALVAHYGEIFEDSCSTVNLALMRQAIEADLTMGPDREHWNNVVYPETEFEYPNHVFGR